MQTVFAPTPGDLKFLPHIIDKERHLLERSRKAGCMHPFPHPSTSALLTQLEEKAGTDLPLLLFPTWPRPKGAAGRLPAFQFPGRARPRGCRAVGGGSGPPRPRPAALRCLGPPDSDGTGGSGRRPRGAEGPRWAGRPLPRSPGGGVADAQVKPTPTYPGNFRCPGSPREARVAPGRPGNRPLPATWSCAPGLSPGASPLGTHRPLGAPRGCEPRQPPRPMEAGGAAPGAGDTPQAEVSAGRGERREGETQTPWDLGTTRRQWPGS